MAKDRLFFGKLSQEESGAKLVAAQERNWIRVRFDSTIGSPTLTKNTDVGGDYEGFDKIKVGQLIQGPSITNGWISITAIDTVNETITISENALATLTNRQCFISPPQGSYVLVSASLSMPDNYNSNDFNINTDITGSHDSEFNSDSSRFALIAQLANEDNINSSKGGEFAQYEIGEVLGRHSSTIGSFYLTGSEYGMMSEPSGKRISTGLTSYALVELTYSSSIAPIFEREEASFGKGFSSAAQRIALQEYYDDLRVGIYHSGSQVIGNADFINFTGSAVKSITTESIGNQNGILIKIEGENNDTFPYTGSAEITGSLGLTGSFQIESGSTKPFTVNADGTVQLFAHESSYNPTPLLGGIYFTSQSVFLGLED